MIALLRSLMSAGRLTLLGLRRRSCVLHTDCRQRGGQATDTRWSHAGRRPVHSFRSRISRSSWMDVPLRTPEPSPGTSRKGVNRFLPHRFRRAPYPLVPPESGKSLHGALSTPEPGESTTQTTQTTLTTNRGRETQRRETRTMGGYNRRGKRSEKGCAHTRAHGESGRTAAGGCAAGLALVRHLTGWDGEAVCRFAGGQSVLSSSVQSATI